MTIQGYPDIDVPESAQRLPHLLEDLAEHVFQALGAASACWDNLEGAGVFKSEECAKVGNDLMVYLMDKCGIGEPSLGCASTEEIASELHSRVRLGHADPDYRTVNG